jgi:OOP family OmpA-OmpF porin
MNMRSLLISLLFSSAAFAQEASFELEGNTLKVPGPVVFKTASAELSPDSDAVLRHVKAYLDAKSYISSMRIEGHTDNQGDPGMNLKLSGERALAVARWLVAQGVDCKRLIAVGFGQDKPVAGNDTPEGRAQNRRITFVNAALRERAIGGMPLDGGGQVAGNVCP